MATWVGHFDIKAYDVIDDKAVLYIPADTGALAHRLGLVEVRLDCCRPPPFSAAPRRAALSSEPPHTAGAAASPHGTRTSLKLVVFAFQFESAPHR
jgi:hypothetical protein